MSRHQAMGDDLLVLAGAGDRHAFAVLYDRTIAVVYGFVRKAVHDAETAERVTSQIYVETWRTAPSYDPSRTSAMRALLACAYRFLTERGDPSSAEGDHRFGVV